MGNHTYTSDDNHCIAKNEHQKRIVAEAIWLQYLNDCLLKAELIPPHMRHEGDCNRVGYPQSYCLPDRSVSVSKK